MRKSFLALGVSLFALTACAPKVDLPEPRGLAYVAESPMRLDVDHVEVIKAYKSPKKYPHVDHQFPVPPTALVQQWAKDRLLPVGREDYAVVTIEEASVVETALDRTPGVEGLFTIDQTERYDAKMNVRVEVFDNAGQTKGFAMATGEGSQTVTENMTMGQRRQVWVDLMEKVMNQLDQKLEVNIKRHLGQYVKS